MSKNDHWIKEKERGILIRLILRAIWVHGLSTRMKKQFRGQMMKMLLIWKNI